MTNVIAWAGVLGALILFVLGVIDIVGSWQNRATTQTALKDAAQEARSISEKAAASADPDKSAQDKDKLSEYAGLDLSGNWKALAELATALKDLDRSTRLFLLSLAFLAVSGATVGLDAIGAGLGAK